jgi:ribonuclease T2
MRFVAALLGAALLAASVALAQDEPGDFDFYVLSLSWSPTWCGTAPAADGAAQCDLRRGFILHGLWPQYERGYPEDCAEGGRLPEAVVRSMLDLTPDLGLVRYEWRKHGTCTGLSPRAYFGMARAAYQRVQAPALGGNISAREVEDAFIAENPGLSAAGMAISCQDGLLDEVRICLTKELGFRACPEVDRRGCRAKRVRIPLPG